MEVVNTKIASFLPDVVATDGCEVRVLCALPRGAMAVFTLAPGRVARAVAHRTVEEIWVVIRVRGVSISIPTGTQFQLRSDGEEPLEAIAVTMPPWPGDGEAYIVAGKWAPTV